MRVDMPAARIIPEITKVESRAGASYQLSRRRHSSGRVYDFAIEDDEHLLDHVVKVVADARARRDHAAVQEIELGRHGAAVEQRRDRHAARAAVHRGGLPVGGRIGVDDAP